MHPVNLLACAIKKRDCPKILLQTKWGRCCVTGEECETVDRREVFGKSFTNIDIFKSPGSNRCGVDAYIALAYKWERFSSWLCNEEDFLQLNKDSFRKILLGGVPYKKWCVYITTSFKKHGVLKTKINTKPFGFWLFENLIVDCTNEKKLISMYDKLFYFFSLGFGRESLESLQINSSVLNKIGLLNWLDFKIWAQDKYLSPLYKFLCYMLPARDKEKSKSEI